MWAITGRSSTGTIGFGISKVSGRRRVPRPAARTMAFIGRVNLADPARQVRALLVGQLVERYAHRIELEAGYLGVDCRGQRVHAGRQRTALTHERLGSQRL